MPCVEKVEKLISGTFYWWNGLLLQEDIINEFKSMCTDIWDIKICISDSNNEYTDSVKILCQMHKHSNICIEKRKTIFLIMYAIVRLYAQSRHQLTEYLS